MTRHPENGSGAISAIQGTRPATSVSAGGMDRRKQRTGKVRPILRETHPSYYAFILDGETTLGEYWESNPRSHCHDMMGHIIEWYYNGIAGIIPEAPGFSKVTIRPYLPESMHEFTCIYQSAHGRIKVHVKETGKEILLETEVPEGVEAAIDVSNLEASGKKIVA